MFVWNDGMSAQFRSRFVYYWLELLCLKIRFHGFTMRGIIGKTLWMGSVGL